MLMRFKTDRRVEQVIMVVTVAALVLGCIVVLRPFASAMLWAGILCYSTWPVFARLEKLLGKRAPLAPLLMTLLISVVILVPASFVALNMADNVGALVHAMQKIIREGVPSPPDWVKGIPLTGQWAYEYWAQMAGDPEKSAAELIAFINASKGYIAQLGIDVGKMMLQLTLSVFVAFFVYRDADSVVRKIQNVAVMLTGDRTHQLLNTVGTTIRSVVYGILGTALAQGTLAGLGFLVAGVPAPFLLGSLTFFVSPIPAGPPLVWVPAAIWLFYQKSAGWAVFMAIYGILVISGVDNVIRPYIISRGSRLPFILVFLGVLGGIMAFGFIGVFLGPVLLAVGCRVLQEWSTPAAQRPAPPAP